MIKASGRRAKHILLPFLALVVAVAILLPASLTPNLFSFTGFGINEVVQLLTFLSLIALFLERSLEVFINTWRLPREAEIDNKIQFCERKVAELKAQIEAIQQSGTVAKTEELTSRDSAKVEKITELIHPPANPSDLNNRLSKQMSDLERFNLERANYKAETRKIALWTGLFVGMLISAVGIRGLETLIALKNFPPGQTPLLYNQQIFVFHSLDTLLTGGLIAGGSDGIHKIMRVFTAFFDETRNQIKDSPRA
jgi:hypothetical protein